MGRHKPHLPTVILFAIALGFAGIGLSQAESFPRERYKDLYSGGELKELAEELTETLKSRERFSRADSIFIYKYLGVSLAGDVATRESSKSYFYKLLLIEPDVDIIDLYVSESVNAAFQDTRQEFRNRQRYESRKDRIESETSESGATLLPAASKSSPTTQSSASTTSTSSSKLVWPWVVGGAVIAGGVAAYVLVTQDGSDPKKEVITNRP